MIQSPRDASIAFATMLLCTAFFTGHWWLMLLFAAVLFPWRFFGGIVEEHVLPWFRHRFPGKLHLPIHGSLPSCETDLQ